MIIIRTGAITTIELSRLQAVGEAKVKSELLSHDVVSEKNSKIDGVQNSPTTSLPALVPNARQIWPSMFWLTVRVDPSVRTTLTIAVW